MLRSRHLSIALLISAGLTTPSLAQQIAIRPAGADGRFQTALDPKTSVPGFKAPQVAAFRAEIGRVTDRLIAMPEVNTPPPPLCMRVSSYVEIQSERGMLEASVDVHRPVIVDGRCTRLTGSTVQIWFNRTDNLFLSGLRQAREQSGEHDWFVLPLISETKTGLTMEDDGEEIEVFTHGRAPLLLRVSIARALGRTAPGAPEDAPACLVDYQIVAQAGCPLGQQLVELNPDYFDTTKPEILQFILMRTPKSSQHGESQEAFEGRRAIWRALDRHAMSQAVGAF